MSNKCNDYFQFIVLLSFLSMDVNAVGTCGAGHVPSIGNIQLEKALDFTEADSTVDTNRIGSQVSDTRSAKAGAFQLSIFNETAPYDDIIANGNIVDNDPRQRRADITVTTVAADWGVNDRLTLTLQVPIAGKLQDQDNPQIPANASRDAWGLSDISLGASYDITPTQYRAKGYGFIPSFALSFPTGGIEEAGGSSQNLPQPFQLGSGAFEARVGAIFYRAFSSFVLYNSFNARLPLERNKFDYKFGNEYNFAVGVTWQPPSKDWIRFRLETQASIIERDNVSVGTNTVVNANFLGANGDVNNTGGEFVYIGLGIELDLPYGFGFSVTSLFPLLRGSNGAIFTNPMNGNLTTIGQVASEYIVQTSISYAF
jgi:hypothetical protein